VRSKVRAHVLLLAPGEELRFYGGPGYGVALDTPGDSN
jgi:hypothetical protein